MYATLELFKNYINTSATSDDGIMERSINTAQDALERALGEKFETTSGIWYGKPEDIVHLPDVGGDTDCLMLGNRLWSLTTLTNGDATAINSTSYWLGPRNSTEGYSFIRLRTDEAWIFNTDGEITVDGFWGRSTSPPPVIVEATLEWAAYLYKLRDNPVYDVTATPELGIMTVPKGMPESVRTILREAGYLPKAMVV